MAWIEYHTQLRDHWKVQRLADILGIEYHHALGLVSCLWLWCVDYAQDGNVTKFSDTELRHGVRTNLEKFCKEALKSCELIDEKNRINDWGKYGIKYLESARLRVRKHRDMKRYRNVTVTPTQPNPTIPNPTNKKTPISPFEIPEDLKCSESEIKDWLEYKKQRGQTYKPKGLEALWRAFRSIPADRRRETVDHSMSNNWAGLYQKNGGNNGQQRSNRVVGSAAPIPGKYDHLS